MHVYGRKTKKRGRRFWLPTAFEVHLETTNGRDGARNYFEYLIDFFGEVEIESPASISFESIFS